MEFAGPVGVPSLSYAVVRDSLEGSAHPALRLQPWQLSVVELGHVDGQRLREAQLHLDMRVADVLVFVGHLDEAVAGEASERVEGVRPVVEDLGIEGRSLDGGGVAGHGLQSQTSGGGRATLLI